jgi:hypothetical protein
MMTSSAEDCWRLSRDCGRWAAESRHGDARLAFREMATAWARLAFSEEFRSPVSEHIDLLTAEDSQAMTAEDRSSSPVIPSSETIEAEVDSKRDWMTSMTLQTARKLLREIERAQAGDRDRYTSKV